MTRPIRRIPSMRPGFTASAAPMQQGPILPGEFRPLAPTPAASESGAGPTLPEAELIRQLVLHYRWCHLCAGYLKRYNPHRREFAVIEGGRVDA